MSDIFRVLLLLGFMAGSYLLGSVNSAVLISRTFLKSDVRESGSGSAGTTNMLRTGGALPGVLTLLCDCLKGLIASMAGRILLFNMAFSGICAAENSFFCTNELVSSIVSPMGLAIIMGFCSMLGHIFPIFFGFKGGKGVATALTVMLSADWRAALMALGVFIIMLALSKYVSLGSIMAAFSVPFFMFLNIYVFDNIPFNQVIVISALSAVPMALLIFMHRSNIGRLLKGTENKFAIGNSKNKQEEDHA